MTKEQLEQRRCEIQAELDALAQKIQSLESGEAADKLLAGSARRWKFSNHLVPGWMPFLAGIALISGLVFAQTGDALFIDERGNVGIGTAQPGAKLDVQGTLRVTGLQIGNMTVGERELQTLSKLAQGNLQVDIFNVKQGEFLYAADFQPYDNDRRRVFTWRQKTRINQGQWILMFPQ